MKYNVRSRYGLLQSFRLADIAVDEFNVQSVEVLGVGCWANQTSYAGAILYECFDQVPADESRCTGDQITL